MGFSKVSPKYLSFVQEYCSFAHCVAGGCASIATSFVFTPSEHIKQQMQVGSHYNNCWYIFHLLLLIEFCHQSNIIFLRTKNLVSRSLAMKITNQFSTSQMASTTITSSTKSPTQTVPLRFQTLRFQIIQKPDYAFLQSKTSLFPVKNSSFPNKTKPFCFTIASHPESQITRLVALKKTKPTGFWVCLKMTKTSLETCLEIVEMGRWWWLR